MDPKDRVAEFEGSNECGKARVQWCGGAGAQSPAPEPIENDGNGTGAPTCGRLNA